MESEVDKDPKQHLLNTVYNLSRILRNMLPDNDVLKKLLYTICHM